MAEKKVTGPASYFPSIEKKYGKPIEHWMKELKKVSKLAHMEQVAHLKESLFSFNSYFYATEPFRNLDFNRFVIHHNTNHIENSYKPFIRGLKILGKF